MFCLICKKKQKNVGEAHHCYIAFPACLAVLEPCVHVNFAFLRVLLRAHRLQNFVCSSITNWGRNSTDWLPDDRSNNENEIPKTTANTLLQITQTSSFFFALDPTVSLLQWFAFTLPIVHKRNAGVCFGEQIGRVLCVCGDCVMGPVVDFRPNFQY